ncbi:MAG: glucosaminidase domain-containing protein [Bacillota bacterium]
MNIVQEFDLRQPSKVSPAALNAFLAGSNLAGLGEAFAAAEKHGVNARFLTALAIHESNWGKSRIARLKKNLFGFRAYDKDPYKNAVEFASFEACIDHVAKYIAREYLSPGGKYHNGPTLAGMNKKWATDPGWAMKVANHMQRIPETVPEARLVLNGRETHLPVRLVGKRSQLQLINGSWVELRSLADTFGWQIGWDEANRIVFLVTEERG